MRGDIEDYKTGWVGLKFGLRPSEIDLLIERLQHLRCHPTNHHFHLRSDFEGSTGIGDVEIYAIDEDSDGNLQIE
jgi:hypothetical protein